MSNPERMSREELLKEWMTFTSELGFGDNVSEPAVSPADIEDFIRDELGQARDHFDCPRICEPCGEWLATTDCEPCYGSGADIATSQAAGAWSECEWCAGVGKIHPGCVEVSYADLVEQRDEALRRLEVAV